MYGLIGKITTTPGNRDAMIRILLENESMPGCHSYVVARDTEDENGIWVTEVWADAESHKASLKLPGVQQAIARGRTLIAGFSDRHEIEPVGGIGLPR